MKERICGIYKITCKVTSLSYVGKSVDVYSRFNSHMMASSNLGIINKEVRKYGKENFELEILELCDEKDLDAREGFHIIEEKTYKPNGYNTHYPDYGPPKESKSYKQNKDFKRRYLYIHDENYKNMKLEALEKDTDVSEILNAIIMVHYLNQTK